MKKRLLGLLLAFVMILGISPLSFAAEADIYKATGDFLENQARESAPTVASIGGEWIVIGLTRSGRGIPVGYYNNVVAYVQENINDNSQLHRSKSTENSRVILALTASGYDVTDVAGYNLLEGLTSMTYVKKQGINGPIWALIAFDSLGYEIPSGDGTVTRDSLIETILAAQIADGGWNLDEEAAESDPDMTGMALQALAPYYKKESDVKAAVDRALVYLSDVQNSDGGYSSSGDANSESVVQVIVALTALGINPDTDERYVKNGYSAVDALYTYAVDNGGFEHIKGEGFNQMATEQGYYALTAYERLKAGKTSLYDMSDLKAGTDVEPDEPTTEVPDEPTTEKPEEPKVEMPFTDVKESEWYYEYVEYVYENGLMEGTTKTAFAPDKMLTRAMFATILYRMEGEPSVRYEQIFSDVANDTWYTDGVLWAYNQGIVTGYGNTKFGPDDTITREQMAAMMYRYAAYKKFDTSKRTDFSHFTDADLVSDYAQEAMQWAVANSIINGKSEHILDPLGKAIRAECAAIITRFEQLNAK